MSSIFLNSINKMFCFKFTILSLIFKMYLTVLVEKKLNEILSQLPYVVILHYLPKRQQFVDIFPFFLLSRLRAVSLFQSVEGHVRDTRMTTRVTARCLFIITRHLHISHNTRCLCVSCPPTHAKSFA